MSYNSLFGNPMHPRTNIHNDAVKANLGAKLNNVRDRRHTQQEIPIFDIGNTITYQPVSAYGASLLDTTSLADLRAQILENTNEEAIRLLADGNNEINFYTGGTGASNLKLQVLNSSIDVKNSATLNTANIVVGTNNHIKQKIEDSGSRVLVESEAKAQYCLYSYAAGTNSGFLVQPRRVGTDDILELNNYRNSDNTYQPISINRSITSSSYVVIGAGNNPTNLTGADFVSNGQSVFCNANDVILDVNSSNITPYKNIIPSGSVDIGANATRFNNVYNNISTITNEIRMNTFSPVGSDYRQKGIFFRDGFNGTSNGDNMCIRSIERTDPGPPVGVVGDRLMLSSYGGLSINYFTNNAGNDGATGRIALFHDEITVHKNILPNADGTLDIGFKDSGASDKMFSNIYGNNLWAKTSLHAAQIRAYTNGNPINFHNTSLTFDANQTISVDRVYSSATNRDLFLGCGASDIKMRFVNGGGGETETLASIVPPGNGQNAIGTSSRKFAQVNALAVTATTQVNTSVISFTDVVNERVELNGHFRPATNGNRTLGDGTNRWSEVFATNGTINTSDRNAKKDIQPITDALQFVRKLKPVSYIWKDGGKRKHTGFIAQDVLECNPLNLKDNWAGYIDTGNGLGLRYSEFISINTQSIKELDEKLKIMAIRLNNTDGGDIKVDLNYHTDSSEVIERLEILENRELTPIVEEYDDTELKQQIKQLQIDNRKQEDCISQLISENMNLTEKLNMLMERFDKFVEDKPNVKLEVVDDSDMILSESGPDHMEMVEERLHSVEQKVTKISNKQAKLVTIINKLKK